MRSRFLGFVFVLLMFPLCGFCSVMESHDSPTILRSCPSADCDRIAELPPGLKFSVESSQGEWTKVKLSSELSAWIETSQLKALPAAASPSHPVIRLVNITREENDVRMEITESEPGAIIREEWLRPPTLWLKFENASSAVFEIRYAPKDPIIYHVSVWQDGSDVVTMKLDLNGFFGYEMIQKDPTHLLVKFRLPLKPEASSRWTICLDPGHGGKDTGAIGAGGLQEKVVALGISKMLGNLLEAHGYHVVFTRTEDRGLAPPDAPPIEELEKRVEVARENNANLFLSIHCNSKPNLLEARKAVGTFVYYYEPQNYPLARDVAESLSQEIQEPEYGVIYRSLHVIRETDFPAILVETTFISNPKEEEKLRKERFREAAARGLFLGIARYTGTL